MGRMSKSILTPGSSVVTPHGSGVVIDIRPTPSGKFVIGVEDATGEVTYFTEKALRLAED
jgi:DNA polymerase II small subunit/DNA polymerase delta subunit B